MLHKSSISIITATYNAEKYLPVLIKSLRDQTCKDFEWVVADGASTDNTLKLLSEVKDLDLVVTSQPDFGIYDALNRAIKLASGQYYIVIGADDFFYEKTINIIMNELDSSQELDLLVGQVELEGKLIKIRYGQKFLYGARAYVSSHSVGCVFNKNLHAQHGYYSSKYPIFADTYFIKLIFKNQNLKFKYLPDVFGTFSSTGISSNNKLRTQCEFAHIQLTTERFKYLQALVFFLRLIKTLIKHGK
jgi:glycosyltransferase involved in cell wall biosynthesis